MHFPVACYYGILSWKPYFIAYCILHMGIGGNNERKSERGKEWRRGREAERRDRGGAENVRLCTLVLATHVTSALNVKSKRFY